MSAVSPHATAAERLWQLPNTIAGTPEFQNTWSRLKALEPASFDEVWGSSCALLAATLATQAASLLLITSDLKAQDDLYDDLPTFFTGEVDRLATLSININHSVMVDQEYGDRIRLLKRLAAGAGPGIIVANVQALLQPVPSQESIARHSRTLSVGMATRESELVEWLLQNGFHRTTAVELPGEFSLRAGIMDLFAPDWVEPVRIEFFDDQIESLRQFEISTQRSTIDIRQIEITCLSPDFQEQCSFLSYLPANTVVLQCEPEEIKQSGDLYLQRISDTKNFFSWPDIQRQLSPFPIALAQRFAPGALPNHFRMGAETVEIEAEDISGLRAAFDRLETDIQVSLVARVEGELERIQELLSNTRIAARGNLQLLVGCVHQAFRLRNQRQWIVGCDQLFHRGELRRGKSRRLGKAIDSFMSLREGDLIVHLAHGIGRFRGLKMLDKDGQHTEHLELEFHGGTRIFVPATKIDLVQKYIGGTKTKPVLAKIGGKAWVKQKEAAEQAVTDMAVEMLELQAARSASSGISFGADTHWLHEFEQAFPYRETPDQETAIRAVKQDMQSHRPMDRLICGDVGYGKTEVAMRAAFKAVECGYQVAVLVPTTILAEQHFRTFKERMSEFPARIGRLSRFQTARQQRDTIEQLEQGVIDICIGTHRVVSADVKFANLGLVIIDEEQRFGVAHKDRLKKLRHSIDVLTMSATPIPRTLHMSLVGVRDISNLETPPESRLAVETRVTRFDEELIRFAVLRELNRGGQIYFVHNRVNDIHMVKDRLQRIVPEASIGVGHGQMPEDELETVMTEFVQGRYDILLATTIIESGLDIPNANTMFIDEANRYGLSDLHQLRGRVGRYKHQAYCYLLLDPRLSLTPNAAKRLQAIETFSEMGAGFSIAMRDLEIRGAGNLLGTEQSGHIASVGYELYCQLLEKAVRELQRKPAKLSIDVDIDLPLEAYLPDEYIPDRRQKIDLYRRLARIESFDQLEQWGAELRDRFGPCPKPVERLLAVAEVKLEAAVWQVRSVFIDDRYLGFRFADSRHFSNLVKQHGGILRIIDEHTAYVTLKSTAIDPNRLLALVKSILRGKQ